MRHLKQLHRGTDMFKRTLIVWTLVLSLGTGYALWSAHSVFDRSLERMRGDVTRCFISPARLNQAQVGECNREFDDPQTKVNDYEQVQAQTRQTLKVFVDLQARVKRLEDAQRKR